MSRVQVPCNHCGKSLLRWPSNLKATKFGPFCDRHCLGKFRSARLTGEWAANYKTGSRFSRSYIEVEAKWHPNANARGYISLHRLIAEAKLGRFLAADEVVHHKDHDPRNNNWENLEVLSQAEHAKLHPHKRNEYGRFLSN